MPQKDREAVARRCRERSDALFTVYWQMGPERSLEKLLEVCTIAGLRISINTLKRYSGKYNWQERLLRMQAEESARREKEAGKLVDDMNRQDAMMAQGIKGLVVAGIRFYQEKIRKSSDIRRKIGESGDSTLEMSLGELVNMAQGAQRIERLARGQATSRTDVWVDIAATVVREFVLIFMAVNEMDNSNERETEFLRLGDEMITRYYNDTVKGRILKSHEN